MGKHTSLEMKIWLDRSNKILSRRAQEQQNHQEYMQQQEVLEKMNQMKTLTNQKIPQSLELPQISNQINLGSLPIPKDTPQQFQLFKADDETSERNIKPISIKQIKLLQQRDQMLQKSRNYFEREQSDFESDSENALDSTFENAQRTFNFLLFDSFLQQKEANLQQLKHLAEYRKFDLVTFLNNQLREQNKKKEFQCQYCSKSFDKASALGGHTSKNHPSKSKNYQKRIFSSCIRKIERNRSSFLKNKINSQPQVIILQNQQQNVFLHSIYLMINTLINLSKL